MRIFMRFFKIYLPDHLGIYTPLINSPDVFLVPCIYLNCDVVYSPLGWTFSPYMVLNVVIISSKEWPPRALHTISCHPICAFWCWKWCLQFGVLGRKHEECVSIQLMNRVQIGCTILWWSWDLVHESYSRGVHNRSRKRFCVRSGDV